MKKTSRILAILLTLCVLCSSIALVASSKSSADLTGMLEDVKNAKVNDFEGETVGKNYDAFGSGSGQAQKYSKVVVDEHGDNKYIALRYLADKTDATNYRRDFSIASSSQARLSKYSYVTLDFEIAADKYQVPVGYRVVFTGTNNTKPVISTEYLLVDTLEREVIEESVLDAIKASEAKLFGDIKANFTPDAIKKLYGADETVPTGTTIDEVAAQYIKDKCPAYTLDTAIESARLSYAEGISMRPDFRATSGSISFPEIKISYNGEKAVWQLTVSKGTFVKTFDLPSEVTVWSHITYAIEINHDDYGASLLRMYFDGEFVCETTISAGSLVDPYAVSFNSWIYIQYGQTPYSVAFDNIMLRCYLKNTYSSPTWYGIDDLFAEKDEEITISKCDDVIYNLDYVSANGKYVSVDAGTTKCYIPGYVSEYINDNMVNGAVIETHFDILDFTPDSSIEVFNVSCLGEAEFSLSDEALNNYVISKTPTGHRVDKISKDDMVTLQWYDAKEEGNLIKVTYLPVNGTPNFDSDDDLPDIIRQVDFETGILSETLVSGWLWDIDGEGTPQVNFDETDIHELSEIWFNVAMQQSDGVINIYPKETEALPEKQLIFAIETKDELLGANVPYFPNGDYNVYLGNEITEDVADNLPDNAILHLYGDVEVSSSLAVGKGSSLTVLLNGHNVYANCEVLFSLDNGASLEITNANSESEIYANTFIGANRAALSDITVKVDSLDFRVSVFSNTFLEMLSLDKSGKSNDITLTNVLAAGQIILSIPDASLDVTKSALGTSDGETLFNLDTEGEVNISVSESEIYSDGFFADGGADNVVFAIESTCVLGGVGEEFGANLLLGKGVQLSSDFRAIADITYKSGIIAAVSNTEVTPNDIPGFTAKITTLVNAELSRGDATPVIWKDALGNTFYADLYYKDALSVIAHPDDFTDREKFPVATDFDNGWYNLAYDAWTPATEGTELDLLRPGVENVFKPVATLPEAAVTLMANVNLVSTVPTMTLYFRMPGSDVTNVSFFIKDIELSFAPVHNHEFADDAYVVEVPMALASLDAVTLTVNFTVDGEDLTDDISVDMLTYAETVAAVYSCGTEDTTLVFDLIRYKYEAYVASVGIDNVDLNLKTRVDALFASHGTDGCKCVESLTSLEFTEDELSATLLGNEALKDKILYAGFDFESGSPALYFYVPKTVDVKALNLKFVGLEHKVSGWDYINYKINETLEISATTEYNGVECNVYRYDDMLLCNAASIFNITLEVGDEAFAGSFSLASWCQELKASGSEYLPLAKAFYAASSSAYKYRVIGSVE